MKKTLVLTSLALIGLFISSQAHAQPYLRGSFNAWGTDLMTDMGSGHYALTVTGLTPGNIEVFKVDTVGDWSTAYPSTDVKARADASGELTVHYYAGAAADSWNPATDRVGYDDPGASWSLSGDMNSWGDSPLTDQGGGVYSIDYNIPTAGGYNWKFKDALSWDVAIGEDFGHASPNNWLETTADNTVVTFTLDLPNGRWTTIIPEPTTFAMAGLGLAALIAMRRKG